MSKTYRVAIAASDSSALNVLHDLLVRLGHRVVAEVDSLDKLIQSPVANDLELIICDLEPQCSFDTLNESMAKLRDIPVIIASNEVDAARLERKVAHQVFGVLLKPLREVELAVMIVVAAQRFHEYTQLRDEAFTLRAALEDRKVIERAKGVIMKKCGLDEASAFSHLQHLARQHRQKIIDVAKGILIAETAFAPTVPILPILET
jgi:response regulator NasT